MKSRDIQGTEKRLGRDVRPFGVIMANLKYGQFNQVSFNNYDEYYYSLGFLANSKNAELRWENNEEQGAWGSEGRIHCLVPETRFPQCFRFTAGRGNVYARINCNEYVGTLVLQHHFAPNSKTQNVNLILSSVPENYKEVFWKGYRGESGIVVRSAVSNTSKASVSKKNTPMQKTPIIAKTEKKNEKTVPVEIPVSIGEKVSHSTYGIGTIVSSGNNKVVVLFDCGEKVLANPMAFEKGFLKKVQ